MKEALIPDEIVKQVYRLVNDHSEYRNSCINLIASENFSSPLSRSLLSKDPSQRYSDYEEGDYRKRKYQGYRFLVEIDELALKVAKALFKAAYIDLRPISGHISSLSAVLGLCKMDDIVFELGREGGGHRVTSKFRNSESVGLKVKFLPFDKDEYNIDVEKAVRRIVERRPRVLLLGSSTFLFPHPIRDLRKVCSEVGTYIVYDASHVLGLIAGGYFQSPLEEGADIVVSSTHKTFFGPQGGIIISNNQEVFKKVQNGLYPTLITNHHPHRIPSLTIAMAEMIKSGREYAKQVIRNAKSLAEALDQEGIPALYGRKGYTESHTVLVDVHQFGGGAICAADLGYANIITNKTMLPDDILSGREIPSGIRIGASEVTRKGFKEEEMKQIAFFIRQVLLDKTDPSIVKNDVCEYASRFSGLQYTVEEIAESVGPVD